MSQLIPYIESTSETETVDAIAPQGDMQRGSPYAIESTLCADLTPAGKALCIQLGLTFPLFLAGMGGVAGPALAAAVSEAGGGGTLGLYRCPPAQIGGLLSETRALTHRPFGVNFVPEVVSHPLLQQQVEAVVRWTEQAGESATPFFTFFGPPPASVACWLRARGARTLIQVGSVDMAQSALELLPTALIVQGIEAGGHLLGETSVSSLLEQVAQAQRTMTRVDGGTSRVPLLAAGTVANGADLVRLEASGACGAVCGTRFINTAESDAHPYYKARITAAKAADTVVMSLFEIGWPGRRHRVLTPPPSLAEKNLPANFIATTQLYGQQHPIPRYAAAVPLRQTVGKIEELAIYCGTSCETVLPDGLPRSASHTEEPDFPSAGSVVTSFRRDYERLKRNRALQTPSREDQPQRST